MDHNDILTFWFEEIDPSQWWTKDQQFDEMITRRFSDIHLRVNKCELYPWRTTALGRLAEIIILDQFSRNMYRDQPLSFASDSLALALCQEAISTGANLDLSASQKGVLYMPFMHSESLTIHDVAVELFTENGVESTLDFELKHRVIIEKFGRYPHRNKILGRHSSQAEIVFLGQHGSSF
jgi:uncharacterized protein (DUF924 family)